nr:hypothetical protein [Tanacetum cinerariifolium]GEZ89220.1 hypothetical protein [Tanacetum cinerariifolium]
DKKELGMCVGVMGWCLSWNGVWRWWEKARKQLRRRGKLIVGNDQELRKVLLTYFHVDYVVCQRSKPDLAVYPGLLHPLPVPDLIWTEISMEFIEGLPLSNGKSVNLVVVDRLNKYSHFVALSHPYIAVQVANAFMDHVYKLHELPQIIVNDREQVFMSLFWEELFKDLHTYLRCKTGEKPKEWSKWFSLAEYWYNTNFHTSIQTTPYEAVHGQPPPSPIAYIQGQSLVDKVARSLNAREAMLYKGSLPNSIATLPVCDAQGELLQQPMKVLDRRLGKVGNSAAVYVLIQWSNGSEADATWELHSDMVKRFLTFPINS